MCIRLKRGRGRLSLSPVNHSGTCLSCVSEVMHEEEDRQQTQTHKQIVNVLYSRRSLYPYFILIHYKYSSVHYIGSNTALCTSPREGEQLVFQSKGLGFFHPHTVTALEHTSMRVSQLKKSLSTLSGLATRTARVRLSAFKNRFI